MNEVKEITKKGFRSIVWATIIIGLIINAILSYFFITSGVSETQRQLGMYMAASLLITGAGIGLSISRVYIIKNFEKRLQ